MSRADARLETHRVVGEVFTERLRQDRLHDDQLDLPDGTGRHGDLAAAARAVCDKARAAGTLTHRDIVWEKAAGLFAETDPMKIEAAAIQTAASLCKWVEAIRKRSAAGRFAAVAEPSLFAEDAPRG